MSRRLGIMLVLLAVAVGCRSSRPGSPPPSGPGPSGGTGAPGTGPVNPTAPKETPPPVPGPTPVAVVRPMSPDAASGTPPAAAASSSTLEPDSSAPLAAIPAQAAPPVARRHLWQDVIRLKRAGFTDESLLNKIRAEDVNYELTTAEILELRKAGISEAIVEAMLRSGQPPARSR